MIKSNQIRDLNHVKRILKSLVVQSDSIDFLYEEDTPEYEEACFSIELQLCEIDEFLIGQETMTQNNVSNANLRMFFYWSYIRKEVTFEKLLAEIKEYSSDK